MLRYAITDRRMFLGDERERRETLLQQAVRLTSRGVDYLQVREKDLPADERVALARALCGAIRAVEGSMKVLLSGPPELALAAGVDGTHLPSPMLSSGDLRERAATRQIIVSASCHTLEEIALARDITDLILFAPIYEKRVAGEVVTPGAGLECLRQACIAAHPVPVLALGGVTEANAPECLRVGAAGFASIRAFL